MGLSTLFYIVDGSIVALTATWAYFVSSVQPHDFQRARVLFVVATVAFGAIALVWDMTAPQTFVGFLVVGAIGAIAAIGLSETFRLVARREHWVTEEAEKAKHPTVRDFAANVRLQGSGERGTVPTREPSPSFIPKHRQKSDPMKPLGSRNPASPSAAAPPVIISQGGAGGSATTGPGGVAIGGPGGNSGGLPGRGGEGGGDGVGDVVAGGGGGSVDGVDIWYPPPPSGYEVLMDKKGEKPDPSIMQYGRGGMSPGYAPKFELVEKIRSEYFAAHGEKPASIDENINAMPVGELNKALEKLGEQWRARIVRYGRYEFYVPSKR
jgi:hypothetical protein